MTPQKTEPGRWLIRGLWALLIFILLTLVGLAAFLIVRAGAFSKHLTSGESKDVWTFLGVSIGAAVTLIGTLLTAQYRRKQQALAREAEQRQRIDTVTKVLKLITVDGNYAPRARVAGAITTLIDLHSGKVGIRILGELWAHEGVDVGTAVWLVDQVLGDEKSSADELQAAAYLLACRAQSLVPIADDSDQGWYHWPYALTRPWPAKLPPKGKISVVNFAVKMLLAREIGWWHEKRVLGPVDVLVMALNHDDCATRAAVMLNSLLESGALYRIGFRPADDLRRTIKEKAWSADTSGFVEELVDRLNTWAGSRQSGTLHPAVRDLVAPRSSDEDASESHAGQDGGRN